jgi:hypothetical protein
MGIGTSALRFAAELLAVATMGPADSDGAAKEAVESKQLTVQSDLAIGQTTQGRLQAGDEQLNSGEFVDCYSVDGQSGASVTLSLTSAEFDTYLLVRSGATSVDNDDAPGQGTNSRIVLTFPQTASYRVCATSYAPGETGSYSLSATAGGTLDRLGTPLVSAGELELGSQLEGALTEGDTRLSTGELYDGLTFTASAGTSVTILLNSPDFDAYLVLSGPDGYAVENDDSPGRGINSRIDAVLPHDGVYTIAATSYSASHRGTYVLQLDAGGGTTTTVASPSAAELNSGETRGRLQTNDSQLSSGEFTDTYTFSGEAGERVEINLDSSAFDPYLMLRGPGGFAADNDDRATGEFGSTITTTLGAAGTYSVIVTSYAAAETGAYVLGFERAGEFDVGAEPIASGAIVAGTLTSTDPTRSGGQHYRSYSFHGEAGDRAVVTLTSPDFDTFLTVRGPDGSEETNDDIGGEVLDSRVNLRLPTDGDYTIQASSYRPGDTGSFSLRLAITPADEIRSVDESVVPSGDLAVGVPFAGNLGGSDSRLESGEFYDSLVFGGSPGTTYTITMSSNAIDTYLIGTVGGVQEDNDDGPGLGTNSRLELTAGNDGRIELLVTSYAPGEIGAYTIEISEGSVARANARGRVYAILAGITDYADASSLPFCAEDAEKLHESLAGTGILGDQSIVLTNSEVTAAALERAFAQVTAAAGPDDVILFFYSGHGAQVAGPSEIDGMDETLYLTDGNLLDDVVDVWLDSANVRMSIIALDSCFSGGFARDIVSAPGRMGIFSSEEDVTSNVASRFNAGGYLSHFLREAFEGAADTDPVDGVLTAGELTQYLRREWATNVVDVQSETSTFDSAYQNLVIDRGAVKVSDVVLYTTR